MEFTLRKMTSYDIFPMCTIIKKIGIDEVKRIANSSNLMKLVSETNGKKNQGELIGIELTIDIASSVIANLPNCENELYKFLASISGKTEKELREISPADFLDLIVAVIKHEDFKDFFKRASQLLK